MRVFGRLVVLKKLPFFEGAVIFFFVEKFKWIKELEVGIFGLFGALPDEEEAHEADKKILMGVRGESGKSVEEIESGVVLSDLIEFEDKVIFLMEWEVMKKFGKLFEDLFEVVNFGFGIERFNMHQKMNDGFD